MTGAATDGDRRFRRGVAIAAAVGLVVRLAYTIGVRWKEGLEYDAPVYISRARFLLDGRGFTDPDEWFFHSTRAEGAIHPPGQALWLALGDLLGFDSAEALMAWGVVAGVATIVVIGYLGREVIDERTGLVAAGIAAVYPGLWSYDPTVMAESLAQLLVAVLLLLSYRFWRVPSPSRAAWLGAVAAAGALTRSELVVLIPALVIPVTLASRGSTRQALTCTGSALLWCSLVLAPWVGWNAVRFEHPATLATGIDISLRYANCDEVWYGEQVGLWNVFCGVDITNDPANDLADETELGQQYRARAGAYVRDNLGRLPIVVAARTGRTLGLYAPAQQVEFESTREVREAPVLWSAMLGSWALALLGAVALIWPAPRSRRGLAVLLAPMAAGLAGAAITFGTTRYRSVGEVGLVVLGAAGVGAIGRARAARRAAREQAADRSWEAESVWAPATAGATGPSDGAETDDEWDDAVPLGSTAWSLRTGEEGAVGADERAEGDEQAAGAVPVEPDADAEQPGDDEQAPAPDAVPAAPGPSRRGLVIAQVAIVVVAVIAVLAVVASRDSGGDEAADDPIQLGDGNGAAGTDGGSGGGGGGTETTASGTSDWPAEVNGRPEALGALGTPPDQVVDAAPGTYLWSDFDGWHLWLVPDASGTGLAGSIVADDEFVEGQAASEGIGRVDVADERLEFELPGDQGTVGLDFTPGFFAERLTLDLSSPAGPVDPASVRLGAAGTPVAQLPLEIAKQSPGG